MILQNRMWPMVDDDAVLRMGMECNRWIVVEREDEVVVQLLLRDEGVRGGRLMAVVIMEGN